MENLAKRNKDYAVYLPSVQYHSAAAVVGDGTSMSKHPLPAGLKAADFNWLNPKNKYWHYHAALASAAVFKDKSTSNAICERSPKNIVVGDSGGYQIGTGALGDTKHWKGSKYTAQRIIDAWNESSIKGELLKWLDLNATLAMSIDMPLWVRDREESPFFKLSKRQLLDLSVDNLRFIDSNRDKKDGARILNVLQAHGEFKIKEDGGRSSEASEEEWYQTVKGFAFEGWSLAGDVGSDGGLYRIIRRTLLLRDEGLLSAPRSWMHILKLSPCKWSPLVTQMQRLIRADVNSEFTISYDSSTPYYIAGTKAQYVSLPTFGPKLTDWKLPKHKFPTGITAATRHKNKWLNSKPNNQLLASLNSPIAKKLKIGDMLRDDRLHPARAGKLAQEVLINHNVFTYVMASIMANEIAFGRPKDAPVELQVALQLIESLFKAEKWQMMLHRERRALDRIKP